MVAERAVTLGGRAYGTARRVAKSVAQKNGDDETVDLITGVLEDLEKHGWMLRATLEG
jgi:starvation-inducible DNA-binding protein